MSPLSLPWQRPWPSNIAILRDIPSLKLWHLVLLKRNGSKITFQNWHHAFDEFCYSGVSMTKTIVWNYTDPQRPGHPSHCSAARLVVYLLQERRAEVEWEGHSYSFRAPCSRCRKAYEAAQHWSSTWSVCRLRSQPRIEERFQWEWHRSYGFVSRCLNGSKIIIPAFAFDYEHYVELESTVIAHISSTEQEIWKRIILEAKWQPTSKTILIEGFLLHVRPTENSRWFWSATLSQPSSMMSISTATREIIWIKQCIYHTMKSLN